MGAGMEWESGYEDGRMGLRIRMNILIYRFDFIYFALILSSSFSFTSYIHRGVHPLPVRPQAIFSLPLHRLIMTSLGQLCLTEPDPDG